MTKLHNAHPAQEAIHDQAEPRQPRTLGLDLTEENRKYLRARVNLLLDVHRIMPKLVFGLIGLVLAGFSLVFLVDVAKWELTDTHGRFTLANLPLMPAEAINTDIGVLGLGIVGATIVWLVTKKKERLTALLPFLLFCFWTFARTRIRVILGLFPIKKIIRGIKGARKGWVCVHQALS